MARVASTQSTSSSLRSAVRRGNLTLPISIAVVTAIASGNAAAANADRTEILVPLVVAAGLALGWLAMTRFTYFVAAILLLRASLDALKISEASTSIVDPAAIVSLVFVAAGGLWLLVQPKDERAPRSPVLAPLAMLAVIGAVSTASSPNAMAGLVDSVKLITIVVMLAVLNQVFRSERDVRIVIAAAFVSTCIPLATAGIQYATDSGFLFSNSFARVRATFSHPNPFAIYLSMIIIMGAAVLRYISLKVQVALVWLMAACGLALLATYTRSAWIATAVGIVVVTWFINRRAVVWVVVVGAILVVTVPDIGARFDDLDETTTQSGAAGNSLVWRFEYWKQALELNDDPLLGSGLSTVREEGSVAKSPHNDFIRVFVETGLLGTIAFLWFLWAASKAAMTGVRSTREGLLRGIAVGFAGVMVAYVILSLVSNVITQLVLLWYIGAFAAAAVAAPRLAPANDLDVAAG